jgi:murein tripeptide amidase MpaA
MKKFLFIFIIILVLGGGMYFLLQYISKKSGETEVVKTERTIVRDPVPVPEPEVVEPPKVQATTVLGQSVDGRDITAYHFGTGEKELLFVAGMHGGYSWNTTLLAYEVMDYFKENPSIIPESVTVTVIPTLNPDGLYKVTGTDGRFVINDIPKTTEETIPGRFNANNVDLNRNFDCDWQATGKWQDKTVSGGSEAFSEPESKAIRDYVQDHQPTAVITWYSSIGGVFSSSCHNGLLPETKELTNIYATASEYPASEDFDYYEITGDMVNWFAKQSIPAISVLLTTHDDTDIEKNIAGINAVLEYYNK